MLQTWVLCTTLGGVQHAEPTLSCTPVCEKFLSKIFAHSYTTKICIPHQIPPNNGNHLVSGRIKIGRAKGSEQSVETTEEVIGYELLTNLLRVASDHMKTKISEKEQNPEMTQRTSGRNQLHCNNGSPPKRYDDSSSSKWREKKFESEI